MLKPLSAFIICFLFPFISQGAEKGISYSLYEKHSELIELFTSGKVIEPNKINTGLFFVKVIQAHVGHSDLLSYVAVSSPSDANAEMYSLGSIGECSELEWETKTSLWLTCSKGEKIKSLNLKFEIESGSFKFQFK